MLAIGSPQSSHLVAGFPTKSRLAQVSFRDHRLLTVQSLKQATRVFLESVETVWTSTKVNRAALMLNADAQRKRLLCEATWTDDQVTDLREVLPWVCKEDLEAPLQQNWY